MSRPYICSNCGATSTLGSARKWCSSCTRRWQRHGDPNGGPRVNKAAPRAYFDAHVLDVTDECVLWPYGLASGYGCLSFGRVHIRACEIWHGPRPVGTEAAHSCNTRACFNGAHLRWATRMGNTDDRYLHNTAGHKLTNEQVIEIRQRYRRGMGTVLAREYGVSKSVINGIASGRLWKRLLPVPVAVIAVAAFAGTAAAHTPSHSASCPVGLAVSGTQYQGGQVSLHIGTATASHTFTGASFSYTLGNPDKTISEPWTIDITSNDPGFNAHYEGTVPACQQPTTTSSGSTTSSAPATTTTVAGTSTTAATTSTSTTPATEPTSPSTASSAPTTVATPTTPLATASSTTSTAPVVPASGPTPSASPATTVAGTSPEVAVAAPPVPSTPSAGLPVTGSVTWPTITLAMGAMIAGAGLITITRRKARG